MSLTQLQQLEKLKTKQQHLITQINEVNEELTHNFSSVEVQLQCTDEHLLSLNFSTLQQLQTSVQKLIFYKQNLHSQDFTILSEMYKFVQNFTPPQKIINEFLEISTYLETSKSQYLSQILLQNLPFDWFFTPLNFNIFAFSPNLAELPLQNYIKRQFITAAKLNINDFFADLSMQFQIVQKNFVLTKNTNFELLTKNLFGQVVTFYILAASRVQSVVCDPKNVKILTNKIDQLPLLEVLSTACEFLEESQILLNYSSDLFIYSADLGIPCLKTLILSHFETDIAACKTQRELMNLANQIWRFSTSLNLIQEVEKLISAACISFLQGSDFEFLAFCDKNFKEKIPNFDEILAKKMLEFAQKSFDKNFKILNMEAVSEIPAYFAGRMMGICANVWDIQGADFVNSRRYRNIEDMKQLLRFILSNFGEAPELTRAIQKAEWRDEVESE